YDSLAQDTRQVLKTLIPKEAEVQTQAGQCYLMRILPYRTLENVIEGAVLTFVEITEQKRLQEAEQHYRQLFEIIADAVIIGNLQARFLDCNGAALRLYGYSREEFLSLGAADIVHPADHLGIQKIQERALAGEIVTLEALHRHKDGRTIAVESTVSRIEYRQEPAFFTIVRDITGRKETEQNLRRLATIVADANDAIIVQDFEGQILAWNPAAERIYRTRVQQLATGEAVESFETQRIVKDGRILDIALTATALVDAAGKPYAIATTERDITKRQA
ncbi:MAG: PAS domain S-box protein, partial [Chloroflexi bacterium]|nr:PAS domain S-box protein [Chloroflexota bacterium]